ncbi:tRNA(Ile)-lysidine/2-thiocytidine synthase [Lasiodiplodia theobromae]|uniref:tRNA(Ile)-lysidine synthetase n=1 Tax=Lasiodiplodia theobromae TaxID=45133 RepID=A0A5N5DC39_9PEZI|nr:putative tRNA(Ile)-lysidine synthase [Lasiodiplodia theobromae]KAF9640192.1 tRNA(Ile)-lysidine/2-thiocytidine synthase [Lasiodiplodia theobromae]
MFAPTNRLLAALPVSVAEFRESLASIWLPRVRVRSPRLGLAVSGGVDSMALATLCADLSDEINEDDDTDVFTAFIVDHQLRKGSSEEALEVQENLYKLGVASEILQMQWPEGTDTKSLTNLETLARRFRFRLLGQACRDHGIESLLLAHHSDDQAETVMMRLIEGHRGMGLRGMRAAGDIPECFGMHGVHQSHAEWMTDDEPQPRPKPQRRVDVEFWGVQVLRPLLSFSKARLTATCEASGTPWVEDETNKDPTLTLRNAIRHVYQNYRLPAAISKPALLQLTQRTADRIQGRDQEVESLLQKLDAVLDLRSGELAIRFARYFYPPTITRRLTYTTRLRSNTLKIPDNYTPFFDPSNEWVNIEECKIVAAMLVRRLANLVSPREMVDLSSLETAVRHLFPRLYIHNPLDDVPDKVPASFTAAGVLFERVQTPDDYFPYYTWMLSRQPYPRGEDPTVVIPPKPSSSPSSSLAPGDEIPFSDDVDSASSYPSSSSSQLPDSSDPDAASSSSSSSPFTLYDGRWWLRVHNPSTTHPLTIRPFRQSDLKPLRAALTGPMRARFEALRTDAARSKARFVLPVIAAPASSIPAASAAAAGSTNDDLDLDSDVAEGEALETATNEGAATDADVVIAVPTFGVKVNVGDAARAWKDLRWEVRYKKLDAPVVVRDLWDEPPAEEGEEEEAVVAGGQQEVLLDEMMKEVEEEIDAVTTPEEDVPFVMDEHERERGNGR